jgi:hypothetical protein
VYEKNEIKKWGIGKPNKKEAKEKLIMEVIANVHNTLLDKVEVIRSI